MARCALCSKPAKGHALINDDDYCHDGESPTCYEKAQHLLMGRAMPSPRFTLGEGR
jgi:hypothetical protein